MFEVYKKVYTWKLKFNNAEIFFGYNYFYLLAMLNHVFILALIMPIVFCRSTIEDRQWKEEDLRQNCTTSCSDECTSCTNPVFCDAETEIKCGSKPQQNDIYELVINCPENDVCIPKGCECKIILLGT